MPWMTNGKDEDGNPVYMKDDEGNRVWWDGRYDPNDAEAKSRFTSQIQGGMDPYKPLQAPRVEDVPDWFDPWANFRYYLDYYPTTRPANAVPTINDALVDYQRDYFNRYGEPLNRPWTKDAQSIDAGNSIINQYHRNLDEYNAAHGTNYQPTVTNLSQLPISSFAASDPTEHMGSGSVLGQLGSLALDLGQNFALPAATIYGLASGAGSLADMLSPTSTVGVSPPSNYWNMTADAGNAVTDSPILYDAATQTPAGLPDIPADFTPTTYTAPTDLGLNEILGGTGATAGTAFGGGSGATDEFGNLIDYSGATPATPADVARQTLSSADPTTLANTANIGTGATAATSAGTALSRLLDGNASTADLLSLGGVAGSTLLSLLGSNAQTDALKGVLDQQRTDRAPALAAYNNALANPDTFYNSAPALGATEAAMRKLSIGGNPANNPGDISKLAAYNLGGYNNYLSTLAGPAFGGQGTQAQLGSTLASAQASPYNAIQVGLSDIFNPQPKNNGLMDLFAKYALGNFKV